MSKQYFVCVYGGASDNISDTHKNAVEELCGNLAKKGFSLVYGAGASGCMGAAARGFRENNGYIMGVTPRFMGGFEAIFDCDNTLVVGYKLLFPVSQSCPSAHLQPLCSRSIWPLVWWKV